MPELEQENPIVTAERNRQYQAGLIDSEIRAVNDLRQSIDVQIQRVKALPPSRERALVITKLQEAVMWLGMDLKRIN